MSKVNISVAEMEALERSNAPQVVEEPVKFEIKNYFNDRLADNENEKKERIRLLTIDKNSNVPFVTIHTHKIKLKPEQVKAGESEWRTFICLEKNEGMIDESFGHKCPFCELNREAYKKEQEYRALKEEARANGDAGTAKINETLEAEWKAIRKANQAKPEGIARLIDRADEDHGPKFWKFSLHEDGTDPMHSIIRLWRSKADESVELAKEDNDGELPEGFEADNILDMDNGKDLQVTITRVPGKNGAPDKRAISIDTFGNKLKPVSRDAVQQEAWINDEKTWKDVFTVKPYEYCSLIIDGKKPYKDKRTGLWVAWKDYKKDGESQNAAINDYQQANERVEEAKAAALTQAVPTTSDDEDLPY